MFDQVAAKVRDCESSGSEHSPEMTMDLSDLVNSFIENGNGFVDSDFDSTTADEDCSFDGIDEDLEEMKESLKRLFRLENGDDVRKNVVLDVEKAWHAITTEDSASLPSSGFKRQLMARLRDQGFDAGTYLIAFRFNVFSWIPYIFCPHGTSISYFTHRYF